MDCGRFGKKKKNGYLGKINPTANWLTDKPEPQFAAWHRDCFWQLAGAMLTYNIDTNIVYYHAKNFSLSAIENIRLACQPVNPDLVFGWL